MDIRTICFDFVLAALCGAVSILQYCTTGKALTASDIILYQSFSAFYPNKAMLITLTMQYVPFLLFEILLARGISSRFLYSGIFFFSRCTSRTGWYVKETMILLAYAAIFVLIYAVSGQVTASMITEIVWDRAAFLLELAFLVLFTAWLFFWSILMNICCISKGDILGFTITTILQYACVFLYIFCQEINSIDAKEVPAWLYWLIWGNPMSHLMISWHSSSFSFVEELINEYQIGIDLNCSACILIGADFLLWGIGAYFINRTDILINDTY